MIARFTPSHPHGSVVAPPSKSAAHRLLLAAGLAEGTSVIRGISGSEDMAATLDCLTALGARVVREGDTVTVTGTDPRSRTAPVTLSCRESGSTLRFFFPLCLLSSAPATLSGAPSLFRRPLTVYETLAAEQGIAFSRTENSVTVAGTWRAGDYRIAGNVSSQFVTGLLFALPLLPEDSTLTLVPPVESRPYIEMTRAALAVAGIRTGWLSDTVLSVPGGQHYRPFDRTVEGDWSNAAFFLALRTLGADVSVTGLSDDTLQGDAVVTTYLERLSQGTPTLSLADCPDLGPVLMACASALHGATFTDTARLRMKESDRVAAMAEELASCGVTLTVTGDTVTVPATFRAPSAPLRGHNDHRIVMALSTLLLHTGGTIVGAEAVRKSFPDYFRLLSALGCEVTFHES